MAGLGRVGHFSLAFPCFGDRKRTASELLFRSCTGRKVVAAAKLFVANLSASTASGVSGPARDFGLPLAGFMGSLPAERSRGWAEGRGVLI